MKLMSVSSAFILALALPAFAAEKRGDTIAPSDDKAAAADTFMNAKVIAIKRDSIEFRDNDGKKRTLALEEDAAIEKAVKPGSDVILVIKGKEGEERVTAVKHSIGGTAKSSALMNTLPVFIPAPAPRSLSDVAAGQLASVGMVNVPVSGQPSYGTRGDNVIGTVASPYVAVQGTIVTPNQTAAAAAPLNSTAAAQVPGPTLGSIPNPNPAPNNTAGGSTVTAAPDQAVILGSAPIVTNGNVAPIASTVPTFTNANLAQTTAATGSIRGTIPNPNPIPNNTAGGSTVIARPDQAVIVGSAPNPDTGQVGLLTPSSTTTAIAPIGATVPTFTNANLAAISATTGTTFTTVTLNPGTTRGSVPNPNAIPNNTIGGSTVTTIPDQAVILGSGTNPDTGQVVLLTPPTGTSVATAAIAPVQAFTAADLARAAAIGGTTGVVTATTGMTTGSVPNQNPALNNTVGGRTVLAGPSQAVIVGSAPNPATGVVAPVTSVTVAGRVPAGLAGAGATVPALANTNLAGAVSTPVVTNGGAAIVPAASFFGAPYATLQTGVGTSATIGSTQSGLAGSASEGTLGSDAAPLPMAQAVQVYQSAVARAASRSYDVDSAFARYKEVCVGPQATISTSGSARQWLDVWDGAQTPADTREVCAPLLAQAVRIGHEVQESMSAAEDAARRAGVLPGVMRQIRTMYGMDWGGWDR
jgi:hypothetical protein